MNIKKTNIKGLIVPLTTPFDKDEKLDLKTLKRHINYLIETGVLSEVIPTSETLGSNLNIAMIVLFVIVFLLYQLIVPFYP